MAYFHFFIYTRLYTWGVKKYQENPPWPLPPFFFKDIYIDIVIVLDIDINLNININDIDNNIKKF